VRWLEWDPVVAELMTGVGRFVLPLFVKSDYFISFLQRSAPATQSAPCVCAMTWVLGVGLHLYHAGSLIRIRKKATDPTACLYHPV
jgi:hypothetical protein